VGGGPFERRCRAAAGVLPANPFYWSGPQLQRWLRDCGLGGPAAPPTAPPTAGRAPPAAPEASSTVWVVAELGGGSRRRRELDGAEILRQALVCERGGSSSSCAALEHALRCGDSLGKRKLLRKALAFLLTNSGRASDDGSAYE
jgi:hypothetical protein